jgi:ubiquinone/menaquinone biosynthesis C-methylase UbiE
MIEQNRRREFYTRIAKGYDDCAVKEIGYTAHRDLPTRALELHPTAKTALDLACGTGLSSQIFFDRGLEVSGIDYSHGMVEVAQTKPYKQLFCQSIEDTLPFNECTFDIVTAIGVTEFLSAPAKLLKSVWRVLRDGGVFALTLPVPSENAQTLAIKAYSPDEFVRFVDPDQFEVTDQFSLYGWKSYTALFLRKRS